MHLKWYLKLMRNFPDSVNILVPEMDNILDVRDSLQDEIEELTPEELAQVEAADQKLLQHRDFVLRYLGRDPKRYREEEKIPPNRWWWYLDEQTPAST